MKVYYDDEVDALYINLSDEKNRKDLPFRD